MVARRPLGKVLVATDFSAGAKRALERACRLPLTPRSTLTLLHVIPKLHASFYERAERTARATLEAWAQEARGLVASNVDVRAAIETGEPYVEIARRAAAERAELIAVGRHGHRQWPHAALGSTAERVLREGAMAALVVVDAAIEPYRRPLVAVDEEGSAKAALDLMARIVAPEVRGALAIHALYSDVLSWLSLYDLPPQEIDVFGRARADAARQAIEQALDRIGSTELDFDLRFVTGHPRAAILEAAKAEQADLIAVGTHGRTGLRHFLLGSVAEAVIRGAQVDVLVNRASFAGWAETIGGCV
jgi:nucleotide-binding universal stress UspA family protein